MKITYMMFLLPLLAWISSCHNSVGPIIDRQPGSRNYTWYVDTINTPENTITSLDGVSDTNVWAVSTPGDFRVSIWHFDGKKWSTDSVYRVLLSPFRVRTFSAVNSWIVGNSGEIWINTGSGWNEQAKVYAPIPDMNGFKIAWLEDIDGFDGSNLYAVGEYFDSSNNGHTLAFRQNGSSWTQVKTRDMLDCDFNYIRFYAPGKALIWSEKSLPDGSVPDSNKIFEFDGTNLHQIYSDLDANGRACGFAPIQGGIVVLEGRDLIFMNESEKENLITIQEPNLGGRIEARSTEDVFLTMTDGVAHYNGTDVQYLFKFPNSNTFLTFIRAFPGSVFVSAHDYSSRLSFIYRGYLQQ
ncbi:MAG: hypothetical protein M1339_04160 [Bacteroidetes bacterium]|nr:hypothetical protein [Bacteroidota bacterium]